MWSDVKRYRQASPARKQLLREALGALVAARVAMACVSFRRIAAWLGAPGSESPAAATAEETHIAEEIGWAVSALGSRVPWDGRCLAQALAATGMLRRRGLEGTVSIGVRESESAGFDAHAWLRMGPCIVTGGSIYQRFKALTTFSRRHS